MGYKSNPDIFEDLLGDAEQRQTETIHESKLANLVGITRQQVSDKARSGILKRVGPATYAMPDAVRDYCSHLRGIASRVGQTKADGDPADPLKAEKLRLTRAQADKEEVRVARERGELVEARAVELEWSNVLRDLRNALLAVPSRCGATLPHLTTTDIATMEREIRNALEGVAHGN